MKKRKCTNSECDVVTDRAYKIRLDHRIQTPTMATSTKLPSCWFCPVHAAELLASQGRVFTRYAQLIKEDEAAVLEDDDG